METRINPPTDDFNKPGRSYIWVYISIILLLIGSNLYFIFQHQKEKQVTENAGDQIQSLKSEKEDLQNQFNAASFKLDQLTSNNLALKGDLAQKGQEIIDLQKRIQALISKEKATKKDLQEAQTLINELNFKLGGIASQVQRLSNENAALTTQRDSLITEGKNLKDKVKIAQRLHASNIHLKAINLRKKGHREEETSKAKRVDLLRIVFDINENDLVTNQEKAIQVRIINPDGELLSNPANGSGSFVDEKGKTVFFTTSDAVQLTPGMSIEDITIDWRQADSYKTGPYVVEIYCDGILIGQGTATLK